MSTSIEWLVGIIRGGESHNKLGDKYTFSMSIILRGNTAELCGAVGDISRKEFRELCNKLKSIGVTTIIYDRIKNGVKSRKSVEI